MLQVAENPLLIILLIESLFTPHNVDSRISILFSKIIARKIVRVKFTKSS